MASVSLVVEGTTQIIAFAGAALSLVILFALTDLILARGERAKLASVRRDPAIAWAVSELLRARNSFANAVARYEDALRAPARPKTAVMDGNTSDYADSGLAGGVAFNGSASNDSASSEHDLELDLLLDDKQSARERLLNAQRDWHMIRPGAAPAAASDLWFGAGSMRAWQIGPIGFERHYFRFDHVLDDSCWSIFESSRFRLGLGFGAEAQSLALFVVGAPAEQLPLLSAVAFGGPEIALRPGFVPLRWWRRIRRNGEVRAANASLLRAGEVGDLIEGPGEKTRKLVLAALETELGETLTPRTKLVLGPALMSVITKGPSVLAGAWFGPLPKPVLQASSDHGVWQEPA